MGWEPPGPSAQPSEWPTIIRLGGCPSLAFCTTMSAALQACRCPPSLQCRAWHLAEQSAERKREQGENSVHPTLKGPVRWQSPPSRPPRPPRPPPRRAHRHACSLKSRPTHTAPACSGHSASAAPPPQEWRRSRRTRAAPLPPASGPGAPRHRHQPQRPVPCGRSCL